MAGSKRNKLKKPLPPMSGPPSNAEHEDNELADDLLAQLDARDATVQQQSAKVLSKMEEDQDQRKQDDRSRNSSKSRYKAREIRKAAARVAQLTPEDEAASERLRKEAEEEQRAIREMCDAQGLEIHEINPDGHCLFAAVADQLALLSILPVQNATYHKIRQAAADYIEAHPDDFLPFLLSTDGGAGSTDAGLMSPEDFQKYCSTIRDTGEWGGEPEIMAIARAFDVLIHVFQCGVPSVVVHSPQPRSSADTSRAVRVSYHRRMYGLGEHYNSLRPKNRHPLGSIQQ